MRLEELDEARGEVSGRGGGRGPFEAQAGDDLLPGPVQERGVATAVDAELGVVDEHVDLVAELEHGVVDVVGATDRFLVVGHVGDGNFHTLLLLDMDNAAEVERAEAFVGWLNDLAISMDGTCTGEHGIGQGKRPYLDRELGPAVDFMRTLKAAFDPDNLMNPGKVV